jgi:hypothetical protein
MLRLSPGWQRLPKPVEYSNKQWRLSLSSQRTGAETVSRCRPRSILRATDASIRATRGCRQPQAASGHNSLAIGPFVSPVLRKPGVITYTLPRRRAREINLDGWEKCEGRNHRTIARSPAGLSRFFGPSRCALPAAFVVWESEGERKGNANARPQAARRPSGAAILTSNDRWPSSLARDSDRRTRRPPEELRQSRAARPMSVGCRPHPNCRRGT